jgi:hypothetical protein
MPIVVSRSVAVDSRRVAAHKLNRCVPVLQELRVRL